MKQTNNNTAKIQAVDEKVKAAKDRIATLEKGIATVEKEWTAATKDLRKQLNALDKQIDNIGQGFSKQREVKRKERDKLLDAIKKLENSKQYFVSEDAFVILKENGQIMTATNFVNFIRNKLHLDPTKVDRDWFRANEDGNHGDWDIRIEVKDGEREYRRGNHYSVKVIQKKLSNGIQLVRLGDSMEDDTYHPFSYYFAFYGLKVVGFYKVKNPEHAGDFADYTAWIGKKNLSIDKKETGPSRKNGPWSTSNDLRFRDWRKRIQDLDPTKLDAVDFSDKENVAKMLY